MDRTAPSTPSGLPGVLAPAAPDAGGLRGDPPRPSHVPSDVYARRREWLRTHFEDSAERWEGLTADGPVGRIRATVREGRSEMAAFLLGGLPTDLEGTTVLDAGCGPGVLTVALGLRGARVVAADLSRPLLEVARERCREAGVEDRVEFRCGDMLEAAAHPPRGTAYDHVVAMDSLIHYPADEVRSSLERMARAARRSVVFTVAPRTPLLAAMHFVGRLFPRSHKAPAIEPVRPDELGRALTGELDGSWALGEQKRVSRGFYISHGMLLRRTG